MNDFERRVRAVDWSRYHHAYGPAEDVPDLLLAIAKADDDEAGFSEAVDALWGNVFHQGTRWGVTAKTVPFFIELLTHGPALPEARRFLVRYLHHLAVGYPEGLFPGHFPLDEFTGVVKELEVLGLPQSAIDGDVFGDDLPEAVQAARDRMTAWWERDCYLAVERGLPAVLELVTDEDEELALAAMALVSSFPARRSSSAPKLWSVASTPSAIGRRGPALVALAQLGEAVVEPARVLMDGDDGLDGLYAACAEILGSTSPSEVARRRLTGLREGVGQQACPFCGEVAALVALCLEKAPPSDPVEAMTQLTAMLASAKGFQKMSVLARLLGLAFPTPLSAGATLSPLQRQAVTASVEHGFWMENMVFANQAELFRNHGLPVERDALRRLVPP